ncbi:MAG: hypothetical protein WC807_18450 [Hyphomicrobium sp.]|jgi:microcystin-dependent protein
MADAIVVFPPGWRALDVTGAVLSGAKIEFFLAGGDTGGPSYSDGGLLNVLPNPVICDSGGFPTSDGNAKVMVWRGTADYRVRLRRSDDTTVWDFDNQKGALPFTSVQASLSVWDIGDVKEHLFLTAPSNRWLILNGGTIGSANSNATARASDSADTLALYTGMWDADTGNKLVIYDSGGTPTTKGSSAGADFLANKQLKMPTVNGRARVAADNMGGVVSANLLTGLSGGVNGDIPFDTGGGESVTLTEAQLPVVDPDSKKTDGGHTHPIVVPNSKTNDAGTDNGVITDVWQGNPGTTGATSSATTGITFSNIGSGDAHNNVQPTIIVPLVLVYAGVP